jgi:hypothetical protein
MANLHADKYRRQIKETLASDGWVDSEVCNDDGMKMCKDGETVCIFDMHRMMPHFVKRDSLHDLNTWLDMVRELRDDE